MRPTPNGSGLEILNLCSRVWSDVAWIKIDSRTLPVAELNERRRRAVKMRLHGVSLKAAAAQGKMP